MAVNRQESGYRESEGALLLATERWECKKRPKNKYYSAGNNNSHARLCKMPTMLFLKYPKVKISLRSWGLRKTNLECSRLKIERGRAQQRNRENRKGAIVRFTSIIIQLMEKATLNLKACFPTLGHREGHGQAAIQPDTRATRPEMDKTPCSGWRWHAMQTLSINQHLNVHAHHSGSPLITF